MKGLRLFTSIFLPLFCCLLAAPAGAVTIDYTTVNPQQLQVIPIPTNLFESDQALNLYPSSSSGPLASGNTLNISADVPGNVLGGLSKDDNVTGNTVNLSGNAKVTYEVYGGYIFNSGNVTGNVTGNVVNISGSAVVNDVYGGRIFDAGNATGNIVNISGNAVVQNSVYGGYSDLGNATGNIVNISGNAVVQGEVYGGYIAEPGADATGNIVSLGGSVKVGNIIGSLNFAVAVQTDDNTLRVSGKGIEVVSITNFNKYEFTLPAGMANGDTMVTSRSKVNLDNVTTTLALAPGAGLNKGDSITLVDNANNANTSSATAANFSTLLSGTLELVGDELKFLVTSAGSNPRTKALAEGRAASMAFVNQGGDMAAGPGLMAAYSAAPGLSAFAAIDGGKSRYKSGSHVDVKGFSMLTGLAWKRPHEANNLMLGGFLEAGWGNYDSHNSFSNFASVEGEGDVSYLGGGLMGRYGLSSGLYFDGSMRVGRAKSDFDSDDLNYGGVKADYDSSTTYYGLHLGTGYEWAISPASMLDFYGKYLWTHQGSDSMTVAGEKLKLDSSNSHRLRAGLRYSYTTGKAWAVTPYAGAAYEHEFDGVAGGTIAGRSLDEPELKGGTGIGEAGINISPGKLDNLSLGLGVRGYIGQREGVTGNLEFRWTF